MHDDVKKSEIRMTEGPKEATWWDGKKHIPLSQMSESYLRAAKLASQKKELEMFQKISRLNKLIEDINEEAARRGFRIRDFKSKFHKNAKILNKAIERERDAKNKKE